MTIALTRPPKAIADLETEIAAKSEALEKKVATKGEDDLPVLNDDEKKAVLSLNEEIKALETRRDEKKSIWDITSANAARIAEAKKAANGLPFPGSSITPTESEDEKYLKGGPWKSLGHFAYAVRAGGKEPGNAGNGTLGEWNGRVRKVHDHVKALPAELKAVTGMNELLDADGAALVPIQLASGIWERTQGMDENLMRFVTVIPVAGNSLRIPAWNDKSRTGGTLYGGARAYWLPEGAQKTNSSPKLRNIELRLKKIAVLMPVTDELLEDVPALNTHLERAASACFAYEINKAIVRGDGVGKPMGIMSEPSSGGPRIVQAAVSGQGASTVIGSNITSMYARRPPNSKSRLIWLYNLDVEPQLDQLNFTVAGTNSIAANWMYLPPGGLRGDGGDPTLKGNRMIECEHCSALGTEGDIILWDPSSYVVIVKSTGIQGAVSMHLRFDYDETVFRWVFRMDGKSLWDDVLTPANGNTRAPIVTLNSSRT